MLYVVAHLHNPNPVGIALFIVAILATVMKVRRAYFARRVVTTSYVLWGETLFYVLGLGSLVGGTVEIMKSALLNSMVGPPIGLYMTEVACTQIALGLLGLLSLWRGFEFRLAATIFAAVFGIAGAVQACYLLPHNFGQAANVFVSGITLPLVLVILAWLSREAHERTERTY